MSDKTAYDPKTERKLPTIHFGDERIESVGTLAALGQAIRGMPCPDQNLGESFPAMLARFGILGDWTVLLDSVEAFARSALIAQRTLQRDKAVEKLMMQTKLLASAEAWDVEPQA